MAATASSPTYRTIPASPLAAPATESRPAPGYSADPDRIPTTPRVYLCASPAGRGSSAATSSTWSDSTAASGQVQPDVDQVHGAARRRGRVDQVRDLVGAERDGQVRDDVVAVQLAGVDVDAARGVDRDHRYAVQQPHHLRRLRLQARPAADADDPVDHDVRPPASAGRRPAHRRPAARPARPRARFSDSSTASTPQPRRASIAPAYSASPPLSPPPDQQQHPPPVRRPEQVDHRVRQPRRRPLHQRPVRQRRHQLGLGRPHLLDRVRVPHAPR